MSNTPRASALPGEHTVPEVAMDYCFLTKDGSEATLTVLVIKDRDSRAILAHPVLCKGRLRDATVDQAAASIRRLGHHQRQRWSTCAVPWLSGWACR
eukprot:11170477-Alexandrium_andersonii.AAC.1